MDALDLYALLIYPIIYILPAYVANGAPVIFGGGRPIDFNKKLFGKRIFGSHKTIRGLVAGIASGIIVAAAESVFLPYMLEIGLLLAIGTHVGDLLNSFIKRQAGMKPGVGVPLLDQYMFFVVAVLFALPMGHLPGVIGMLFLIVLTGLLHKLTNVGANRIGLKKVSW
ncbi:MAG: CDP-2,3-bis-(O-geranylgeranyl)-sn-glycerol synthase [Candidatus Micrarchaeia archaeon]